MISLASLILGFGNDIYICFVKDLERKLYCCITFGLKPKDFVWTGILHFVWNGILHFVWNGFILDMSRIERIMVCP